MEQSKKSIIEMLNKDTLAQPKILLIEDCQCDTVLIKHILSEYYPFTLVDTAITKAQGLHLLDKNKYDIILLDLNLPDAEGFSHIGEIRAVSQAAPLIVITGTCNDISIEAANKHGADGIVDKSELIGISFYNAIEQAVDNVVQI